MCIRERLRAVSTVRQCTVGLARSTCPCPLGGPPIPIADCDRDIFSQHGRSSIRLRRRRGVHYPTHADSMSKFLSSRSARLFLCVQKQLNIN
jgi:hypothetical protein